MSSLLADLPAKFGASIFKSYGIEETGFSKDRIQVKRRMQMKTFIDYLVSNNRLEKTECVGHVIYIKTTGENQVM